MKIIFKYLVPTSQQ